MPSRKEELLAAAREQLTNEKNARAAGTTNGSAAPEIRYRGQVLRGGSAGAPGSGIGSSNGRSNGSGNGGNDDVRAALQKVKELFHDGLISRAEAEQKRSEILGRL